MKATVTATENTPIELPEGTQLSKIDIYGNHLVLEDADGGLILILNGALNPPTILLGSIEIPAEILSASLGSGAPIVPAAGPDGAQGPDSSGQNFEVPPGTVGDPLDPVPLLPPTAFDRQFETVEEFAGLLEDEVREPLEIISVVPERPTVNDPGLDRRWR